MKKLLSASLLTVGLSMSVFAAQTAPSSTKGQHLDPKYAGVSSCNIALSTGTAAVLCASGSGIILQVLASSTPANDYLTFRDSATANTTSAELFRYSQGGQAPVGGIVLPRFKNGLSVNASATPGPGASGNWSIIYVKDLN